MKTAIKIKNPRFVCRQQQVCPDCGMIYAQQKTRRIRCDCGRTPQGAPREAHAVVAGRGWLTQETVKEIRRMPQVR